MGILDQFLSNPAKKAANLLKSSLKAYIILAIIAILILFGVMSRLDEDVALIVLLTSPIVLIVFLISIINSHFYKLAVLDACQKIVESPSASTSSADFAEEQDPTFSSGDNKNPDSLLTKYKQLLDCGAITQEEFDKKKDELFKAI